MHLRRLILLFVATLVYAVAGSASARPVPGLSSDTSVSDTADLAVSSQLADPVVLEPIRPLFPVDREVDSGMVRPEPCGSMSPFLLGLTFVSLSFLSGTRRGHGPATRT